MQTCKNLRETKENPFDISFYDLVLCGKTYTNVRWMSLPILLLLQTRFWLKVVFHVQFIFVLTNGFATFFTLHQNTLTLYFLHKNNTQSEEKLVAHEIISSMWISGHVIKINFIISWTNAKKITIIMCLWEVEKVFSV